MIEPIAVIGLGNMGMSVLGALLDRGLRVVAVDLDPLKLEALADGRAVVPEHRAEEILKRAMAEGRLTLASDCSKARDWPVVFLAVQTPAVGNACDYTALRRVCRQLVDELADDSLVIVGSTVFPGSFANEVLPCWRGRAIDVVYQPVFLRAGYGIDDFLRPGKVVVGLARPDDPPSRLLEFLSRLRLAEIASLVRYEESEWIKLVHNAFMSLKIAFVNEIALLCEQYPVRADRVIELTLTETEHGRLLTRSHTTPGIPFSGPCLPKDSDVLRGMVEESRQAHRLREGVCAALAPSNRAFRDELIDRWLALAPSSDSVLGIVGMSFRPGFNEMRHGLALDFVRAARQGDRSLKVYDPAFENIGERDFVLACRQDEELLKLRPLFHSLEEVWKCDGVLLNRPLSESERARVQTLPRPRAIDLYGNA